MEKEKKKIKKTYLEEVMRKSREHVCELGHCRAAVPKIAAKIGLRGAEQSLRELRLPLGREEEGGREEDDATPHGESSFCPEEFTSSSVLRV